MAADQHYDVIIIGTGAGGGTLAHRLAPSGKRVLLLERGDYLPRERENWDSSSVFVQGRYRAPEFWYDQHGHEFPPEVNYYVGGNTKFYGAALFRLRPQDFGESGTTAASRPPGRSATTISSRTTPQAEHLYRVHGRHGEDPTEGPASAEYRFAPVEHEPRIQQLSDDLEKQGLHPFHLPIGVDLIQDEHGRATRDSVCIRCDRVDGFPCLVQAKSDAQVICVDPALQHDNVSMLTNAHVLRLETDPTGRTVTQVVTEIDGSTVQFSADIVVVACGAVNSAVLLLRSAERPPSARSREQLRRRRPPLPAAQQPRADGGVEGAEPDPVPEDPGDERLVPRRRRLGLPARRDPDAGQVRHRAGPQRRATLGRQGLTGHAVRDDRPPRGRLLAVR